MKRFISFVFALPVMALTMMAQEAPQKYGIKSGTVKAVTEMMGQKIESTACFDCFGALEASQTQINGMDVTTVVRDGKTYDKYD